jgi:hypothetical protein
MDPLEPRTLLSTINWVSKGSATSDSDKFNSVYGFNADRARLIVQRAIDDWERIILNFNRSGGSNTYNLTVDAEDLGSTARGRTSNIAYDLQGKPTSARVTMDDDGGIGGGGWYFDPEPGPSHQPDDSEFTFIDSPFQARNLLLGTDFYRTVLHEIGHAMGLAMSSNRLTSLAVDIGDDPNDDGTAHLFTLDINPSPGSDFTFTNAGGAHLYEGPSVAGCPIHPNELMNSGRAGESGRRNLISDDSAVLLRDVYGYTIHMPSQQNTFYVQLNRTNLTVVVNGDIKTDGDDTDFMEFQISGGAQRFMINGTTEAVTITEFFSSTINANQGNDYMLMDSYWSPVTVNGAGGHDTLILSQTSRDLFEVPHGITFNGSLGFDSVRMYDSNANRSDTYTITPTFVGRPAFTLNLDQVESVDLTGQIGNNIFNLQPGLETEYRFDGGGGTGDLLVYDDATALMGRQYTVGNGQIIPNGTGRVGYTSTVEIVRVDAGSSDDTFTFIPGDSFPLVGFRGFGGNDAVIVDDRADSGDDSYSLFGNLFGKSIAGVPGGGNLPYAILETFESFSFHANQGNNFVGVYSADVPTFVFGNDGNDRVEVNDGTVMVNTGAENPAVAPFGDFLGVNMDADTGEDLPALVLVDQSDDVRELQVHAGQTIGTLRIRNNAVLRRSAGPGSGLTHTGIIDLSGGALLVQDPGPTQASWRAALIAGRNGGAWNGSAPGSVNALLASSSLINDGVGYGTGSQLGMLSIGPFPVGLNDALLRYTLVGDANLDRKVDIADLGIVASNWQQSPRVFAQGDFDYDNLVGVNDLGMLATNWQAALAGSASPAPSSARSRSIAGAAKLIDQMPV